MFHQWHHSDCHLSGTTLGPLQYLGVQKALETSRSWNLSWREREEKPTTARCVLDPLREQHDFCAYHTERERQRVIEGLRELYLQTKGERGRYVVRFWRVFDMTLYQVAVSPWPDLMNLWQYLIRRLQHSDNSEMYFLTELGVISRASFVCHVLGSSEISFHVSTCNSKDIF